MWPLPGEKLKNKNGREFSAEDKEEARTSSAQEGRGKMHAPTFLKLREFLRAARKYNVMLEFRSNPNHKHGHIIECRVLFNADRHLGWIYVANVDKNGYVKYEMRSYWPKEICKNGR